MSVPCRGRRIYSVDGDDFDCGYENAPAFCEDCVVNGGKVDPSEEDADIKRRLCDIAIDVDEYLHSHPSILPPPLRDELCKACDDYLVGEKLDRNRQDPDFGALITAAMTVSEADAALAAVNTLRNDRDAALARFFATPVNDRWSTLVTEGEATGCYPCDTCSGFRAQNQPCNSCSAKINRDRPASE